MFINPEIFVDQHDDFLFPEATQAELSLKNYAILNKLGGVYCFFAKWGIEVSPNFSLDNYLVHDLSEQNLHLFGGSVCDKRLILRDDKWLISKETSFSGDMELIDAFDRHIEEAKWVSSEIILNTGMFPKASYQLKDNALILTTEFIPCNTLGEAIWTNKYSIAEVSDLIGKIFAELNAKVYVLPAPVAGHNYITKIKRRWENLMAKNNDPIWKSVFEEGIQINGRDHDSLTALLLKIERHECYQPMNECYPSKMCHGDLIPEDILVNKDLTNFLLIDPNPQNTDPICDWSKMIMAVYTYYDLAIRDDLKTECTFNNGSYNFFYNFADDSRHYRHFMDDLLQALLAEDAQFMKEGLKFHPGMTSRLLMLNAGLMAISIVPFHILQHKNKDRSLFFLTRGLELINRIL
jgi:hypothetical protein